MQLATTTLTLLTLITSITALPARELNKGNRVYGIAKLSNKFNDDGTPEYIPKGQGIDGLTRIFSEAGFGKPSNAGTSR
ncbi:hypothetical protein E2P81_ATG01082 [Venturia nashicola]|nr:hypothetical protein E2P81_ATG01082 [Venturia nashicola]